MTRGYKLGGSSRGSEGTGVDGRGDLAEEKRKKNGKGNKGTEIKGEKSGL